MRAVGTVWLPLLTLMIFSFNDSKRNTVWRGFTLNYYALRPTSTGHVRLKSNDPLAHPAWTGGTRQLDSGGRVAQFNKLFGGLSLKKN